jgi:hypothetical protein
MKKQKDVKEILRRNGITDSDDLNKLEILGGYYRTFVMWEDDEENSYIANKGTKIPDEVTIVTGDTATVSTGASGETYFLITGEKATVNNFEIDENKFDGKTVEVGDTIDTDDNDYYTYLGKGLKGLAWRIVTLGSTGVTDISLVSISADDVTVSTGATEELIVTGTYSDDSKTVATDDVKFYVEDETIATVTIDDGKAYVNGLEEGSTTINIVYNDPDKAGTLETTIDVAVTA